MKAALVACSSVIVVAACSPTESSPAPRTDVDPAAAAAAAAANDASSPWTTDPESDRACGAKTPSTACEQCCYDAHPTARDAMYESFRMCVCRKPEPRACATECGADFCGTSFDYRAAMKHKGCLSCLTATFDTTNADCSELTSDACAADVECAATQRCILGCPAN